MLLWLGIPSIVWVAAMLWLAHSCSKYYIVVAAPPKDALENRVKMLLARGQIEEAHLEALRLHMRVVSQKLATKPDLRTQTMMEWDQRLTEWNEENSQARMAIREKIG